MGVWSAKKVRGISNSCKKLSYNMSITGARSTSCLTTLNWQQNYFKIKFLVGSDPLKNHLRIVLVSLYQNIKLHFFVKLRGRTGSFSFANIICIYLI